MTDIAQQRVATFTDLAARIRNFAERQDQKAPGNMGHITDRAIKAAEAAERAAAAFAAGDKAAGFAARAEYAELAGFNGCNVGGII